MREAPDGRAQDKAHQGVPPPVHHRCGIAPGGVSFEVPDIDVAQHDTGGQGGPEDAVSDREETLVSNHTNGREQDDRGAEEHPAHSHQAAPAPMPVVGEPSLPDRVMAVSEHVQCSEWRPDHPTNPVTVPCRHTLNWFGSKYFRTESLQPKLFRV